MPSITKNVNLKPYNTFGLEVKAAQMAICTDTKDVKDIIDDLQYNPRLHLVLGGGSNLLFADDFEGIIIHPKIMGIEKTGEDNDYVWLEAGAGVEWDALVHYSVQHMWYGLENLSYIPGNVGASPVQNIGAYGAEVKDTIEAVNGFYITNGKPFTMTGADCNFEYRNSVFKKELKNKVIITSVVFKLKKQADLNLSYGPVKEKLQQKGAANLANLRETIIDIRKSKLPEPSETGNAGSFFKNPVILRKHFTELTKTYPNIPNYDVNDELVKIPAGWLIETAGWKGKTYGGAGVHDKQALVLINRGKATSADIIHLSGKIINDIKKRFDIILETEVNII